MLEMRYVGDKFEMFVTKTVLGKCSWRIRELETLMLEGLKLKSNR